MFEKLANLFGSLARLIKKLECRMARWQVKIRSWHAFGTFARRHLNHAGTQARWHADHVGT